MPQRDQLISNLSRLSWQEFAGDPRIRNTLRKFPQLRHTLEFIYTMGFMSGGKAAGQLADELGKDLVSQRNAAIEELFAGELPKLPSKQKKQRPQQPQKQEPDPEPAADPGPDPPIVERIIKH